jgi:hypothetical protein
MQQAETGIEQEQDREHAGLEILSEDELEQDCGFEQARDRSHELAQHQPQGMDIGIGRRVGSESPQSSLSLDMGETGERNRGDGRRAWAVGAGAGSIIHEGAPKFDEVRGS